ncbi:glycosyltransferase family protein [Prosthecochloris sp.]|uniref:glycosyltransferase family protein n=1 Tax=Prosthecochloris sp. TaxID=290513 RepID=UPI00257E941F|nr:glycosyltransferase family protein [Prosthecochloris sp.]
MKILFGVQGTGNGHISRSRELVTSLRDFGHEVEVIISGRKEEELKEIEVFAPYKVLKGLTLVTYRGKMNYIETMFQLDLGRLMTDVFMLDVNEIDLIITDFEPVTSMAARVKNILSVGFGHQYAFRYDVPTAKGSIFERYTLLNFAPAQYNAGLHWHHFNEPIFPPVIPQSLYDAEEVEAKESKVLVYLPFEEVEDVSKLLIPFDNHEFYIYGKVKDDHDDGHLHYRGYSREGFLRDLQESRGVVCNAGFELPGEALHLGKKLLVRPLDGQIEQESNALAIEELSLGMTMHSLDGDILRDWLLKPNRAPMGYSKTVNYIAEWITKGQWEDLADYVEAAWADCRTESQ